MARWASLGSGANEGREKPSFPYWASWSGTSLFLELENIQGGRILEILYLVHDFHFTDEETEVQMD